MLKYPEVFSLLPVLPPWEALFVAGNLPGRLMMVSGAFRLSRLCVWMCVIKKQRLLWLVTDQSLLISQEVVVFFFPEMICNMAVLNISSWWFQPLWKILVKIGNLPQIGVKPPTRSCNNDILVWVPVAFCEFVSGTFLSKESWRSYDASKHFAGVKHYLRVSGAMAIHRKCLPARLIILANGFLNPPPTLTNQHQTTSHQEPTSFQRPCL